MTNLDHNNIVKFPDMTYAPIDMDAWEVKYFETLRLLEQGETVEEKLKHLDQLNAYRNHFETMRVLATTRYDLNTEDVYYEKQNDLFDAIGPRFEQAIDRLYQVLLEDALSSDLEKALGAHFFNLMRLKRNTFKPEIMSMLERENQLVSEYTKLRAGIRIKFEGQELNIPQMEPFLQAIDQEKRKAAHEALESAFEQKAQAFDQLYDQLVKLRDQIARELGYPNFTPLAYARLMRSDYGPQEVARFREAILNHLVPSLAVLYDAQKKRLGLNELKYYDLSLEFTDGNPTPKGDADFILSQGAKMYEDLSPQTHAFFQTMLSGEWMDLEAKPGKSGGGYCTYIPNYKAPFIFSNFNGTMGDIDVLTHEAGHAYQVYSSRHYTVPEYMWPTLEACEIHSMSMEYFTYPYMERFFKEDTQKYYYAHMSGSLRFIPYGVLVDHFQHWVYDNPGATSSERRSQWRHLERLYLPHKDYDNNAFLESGTYWFRQGHIFMDPFYYIDYTLAAMCALQFWQAAQEDATAALETYHRLCALGGSMAFTELLKSVNLTTPFDQDAVKILVAKAIAFVEEKAKGI